MYLGRVTQGQKVHSFLKNELDATGSNLSKMSDISSTPFQSRSSHAFLAIKNPISFSRTWTHHRGLMTDLDTILMHWGNDEGLTNRLSCLASREKSSSWKIRMTIWNFFVMPSWKVAREPAFRVPPHTCHQIQTRKTKILFKIFYF